LAHLYVLKKVPVWPVMKVTFIICLVLGIILGLFYAFLLSGWSFLANSFMASEMSGEMNIIRGLGFVMIPFFAIFYAIVGAVWALIAALLYNLIASAVGGVELHLEDRGMVGRPVRGADSAHGEAEQSAHVPEGPVDGF